MQIHIDLSKPASQQIAIFSKSKRDSTHDRIGTHPSDILSRTHILCLINLIFYSIIRAALGLPPRAEDHLQYPILEERTRKVSASVCSSVILDAEMVAYSESKGDNDGEHFGHLHHFFTHYSFLQSFGEYEALSRVRPKAFGV